MGLRVGGENKFPQIIRTGKGNRVLGIGGGSRVMEKYTNNQRPRWMEKRQDIHGHQGVRRGQLTRSNLKGQDGDDNLDFRPHIALWWDILQCGGM